MAIEDAMILSRLLGAVNSAADLEAAFKAYDAVRRPRSQRLVESSRRVARVYDFEDEEVFGGGGNGNENRNRNANGVEIAGDENGTREGEVRNGVKIARGEGDNTLEQRMKAYLTHAWDWIWKEDLNAQLKVAMGLLLKTD